MARDLPGTTSDYLYVGDVAAIDITGTALTVAAWVLLDANTNRTVAAKYDQTGAGNQYLLYIDGSSNLTMIVSDSGGDDTAAGATGVSTGVWHHAAGVKNGTGAGALKAYLDGAQDASVTSDRSIQGTASVLHIGRYSNAAAPFDGAIAEVGIWDAALSAAEIAALARGVSPLHIRRPSLRGYWPLFGAAYPEADLGGSANGAAQVGTVAARAHAPVGRLFPQAS